MNEGLITRRLIVRVILLLPINKRCNYSCHNDFWFCLKATININQLTRLANSEMIRGVYLAGFKDDLKKCG